MGDEAEEGEQPKNAEELAQVVDEPEDAGETKKASDVLFNDPNDPTAGQQ